MCPYPHFHTNIMRYLVSDINFPQTKRVKTTIELALLLLLLFFVQFSELFLTNYYFCQVNLLPIYFLLLCFWCNIKSLAEPNWPRFRPKSVVPLLMIPKGKLFQDGATKRLACFQERKQQKFLANLFEHWYPESQLKWPLSLCCGSKLARDGTSA